MKPSPHCAKPRHLDLVISKGSWPASGYFDVVIETEPGVFRIYPTLFLDPEDHDFSRLKAKVSGTQCPGIIWPVGRLVQHWKQEIQ